VAPVLAGERPCLYSEQCERQHCWKRQHTPTCRTAYTPAFGRGCDTLLATSPAANTSGGPPALCSVSVMSRKPDGSAVKQTGAHQQRRAVYM
jgi:hypothetical protein